MPLMQGKGDEAVSANIKELVATGRPQAQAVAIAMRVAGKPRPVGVKKETREVRVRK